MTMTVEDGTGLSNSNSYVSVAELDSYCSDRGIINFQSDASSVKETHLILATDYIERNYANKFVSSKYKTTQSLSYPRASDVSVPRALKYAAIEYAILSRQSKLEYEPSTDASGQLVQSTSTTVGPITKSVVFKSSGPLSKRLHPKADGLISSLFATGGVFR